LIFWMRWIFWIWPSQLFLSRCHLCLSFGDHLDSLDPWGVHLCRLQSLGWIGGAGELQSHFGALVARGAPGGPREPWCLTTGSHLGWDDLRRFFQVTTMTSWWLQTWLDYFPYHIWAVIRNPLTNSYFSRWLKPPTSLCWTLNEWSSAYCIIGLDYRNIEKPRKRDVTFAHEIQECPPYDFPETNSRIHSID
jgi:hypothetical protein